MKHLCSLVVAGLLTAPAMAISFTENFDAGWPNANWSVEGVPNPGTPAVQFPAGDARLQNNAARTAGGIWYERGVSGDGSTWVGGDNEELYLDYHMTVPNGVYTFNVALDVQLYWSTIAQDFGQGYAMYMGDATQMAYGTQAPHNPPTGPWKGFSHSPPAPPPTALTGTKWNKGTSGINNGEWVSWNFNQFSTTLNNTLNVTSGEVIFRYTIRLKNKDQNSPEFRSYALDNLVINLVPEPASLGLLALGGLAALRRRRRVV